jgi:hypothetical protein
MPIFGRLARIERGESFTQDEITADRRVREQVVERLNLRFVVVPDWYEEMPGHAYIRQVLEGCLEALPYTGGATGYRVKRPCPVSSD